MRDASTPLARLVCRLGATLILIVTAGCGGGGGSGGPPPPPPSRLRRDSRIPAPKSMPGAPPSHRLCSGVSRSARPWAT